MQFRVLGPVEVASGDRRVVLTSARQRTILAALLADGGKIVSTDRLIDALWGDQPPSGALKTLTRRAGSISNSYLTRRPRRGHPMFK